MNSDLRFVHHLYRLCMRFFPKNYQEEYAEELQLVFRLALDDTRQLGKRETARVLLREFSSLPKAALLEHLRERTRSKIMKTSGSFFDFAPGTRRERWAALAPFLLFGALTILLTVFHTQGLALSWLETAFALLTVAIVAGLSLIGITKGMPRWFMPYLGLPLPIISILVFNLWLDDWNGFRFYRLQEQPWFLREFVYQGLLWVGLAGSVLLLVVLVRSFANFHPLFKKLKNDWTLLCFIVYGAAPLALVITFDEYRYEEPYLVLAFLLLALFAWIYLRTESPLQKFLALYIGVGLSMSIAAVGKLFIVPLQDWPVTFNTALSITESLSTVVMWLWLALIMLIPPLIHLLLPSESPQT